MLKQDPSCRLRAFCDFPDPETAGKLYSSYVGIVRQLSIFADLWCEENRLWLEAPDEETLLRIMRVLAGADEAF